MKMSDGLRQNSARSFIQGCDDQGTYEVPEPAGGCGWHTPLVSSKAFFVLPLLLIKDDIQEKV